MKPIQLSAWIAYRYLKAKKSVQAINIISRISVLAVTVLAASMIVLLSVFNGFESLLKDLYKAFYPQVKVSSVKGKWLQLDDAQLQAIQTIEGVEKVSASAEDMALIFKDESQKVIILKGVEPSWFEVTGFDSFVYIGNPDFGQHAADMHPAILGAAIAGEFGINVKSPITSLDIYYPQEDGDASQIERSLNNLTINGVAEFATEAEFDGRYIITPLATAQELFNNDGKISSLEIKLNNNANESKVISAIKKITGEAAKIENRYEQNKTINMVMKSEKLAIYIILSFVLIIASFTMVGVLSMIAIDKRKDMSVLRSFGAESNTVFNIFMFKGVFLSVFGAILGIGIGAIIALSQQYFNLIPMEQGFIIDYYPVDLQIGDFLTVFLIVFIVGSIAAFFPALHAKKAMIDFREE